MQLISNMKSNYRIKTGGVKKFQPKFELNFEVGPYLVSTAKNYQDLIQCFTLRNEIFNKEFRGLHNLKYDCDEFDETCDHITIYHTDSNKLVGTYRLNSTLYSDKFYTSQEFKISNLINLYNNTPILELGRACIDKDHRRGIVISLLWKGIAEYMNLSQSQSLFGCSSVKVTEVRDAALVYQYLFVNGHVDPYYAVRPQKNYEIKNFGLWFEYFQKNYSESLAQEASAKIPSLLKSYIKMGAKIIAEPALDEDFNCIDLLTLLHRDQLPQSTAKKFGVNKCS